MINRNNYFYKGYDITSNSKKEHKEIGLMNPFGYNFESNLRKVRVFNDEPKTNQDDLFLNVNNKSK